MSLTIIKNCKVCSRKLFSNNKVGFCTHCFPQEEILILFKNGSTIIDISRTIFNSSSGSYRELIRTVLNKELGSEDYSAGNLASF